MLSSAKTYRPESWNRYSYCYNNPLKYLDPDGRKVKPEDEKALENIRNTLPENLRTKVKLDKNGFIDRKALNKIKSKDANFLDLKKMVNSSQTVEVATASSAVLPGGTQATPFSYQSVEQQRAELTQKLTQDFGAEQAAQIANQAITIPSFFLGSTLTPNQSPTGNLRIELSDQTGMAAGASDSVMAETTAHEMFGHGLPSMQGKPSQHDNGGPVDHQIKRIEDRTRRNFPEQPVKNVVPPK